MKRQGMDGSDGRSRSGKHIGGAHRGLAGGGKAGMASSDKHAHTGAKGTKAGKVHGGGHKPAHR
jgi:hypothetical protein